VPAKDPAERSLIARIAADTRWAYERDRLAAMAAAHAARDDRWTRLVDPDHTLDPTERERRANSARRAHMSRMALRSAQARRAKKAAAPPAADGR
jgi:hypothetical protein